MTTLAMPSAPDTSPPWLRWLWNTPWLWIALVMVVFCAPLFIGLDRTDLENDEAIYSFAVETMVKDGDWLTPKSIPGETRPFLEKPPLKLWITYLPIRLGWLRANEFGLRFMDAAMGALAFLYIFAIGRRLAGPLCGLVAVLLLYGHHPLLYEHGIRGNNMASVMVLAYAAGVYHFLAWRSVNPDVKRHVYAMSLWFVFGFMTTSVAALFLPVILGVSALVKREDIKRLYRDWRTFLAAAVLAIALIAPWFIYQYVHSGAQVFQIMFGAHAFKRLGADLDPARLHPWNYYFTRMWTSWGPGVQPLIVIGASAFAARVWFRRWVEGLVIVLWFAIPIAAMSFGTSKLYHYAYPFLPAVAITAGWLVAFAASRLYRWLDVPLQRFAGNATARALLRTVVVTVALTQVLPLSTYFGNRADAMIPRGGLRDLRACLEPIAARQEAQGHDRRGTWVEATDPPFTSFYYLRGLGPWQEGRDTDAMLLRNMIAPDEPRMLLLSPQRHREFLTHLSTDREALIAEAASLAGLDPRSVAERLGQNAVGVVPVGDNLLFLPGPFTGCARDWSRVTSR